MDRTRRSLVLALLATTACSRPPDLVGIDNPALPAERVPAATEHRLFIMTTREASEATGAFYGAGRAPDLGLASVVVSVPPTHLSGHLERPAHLPPDPSTEFAAVARDKPIRMSGSRWRRRRSGCSIRQRKWNWPAVPSIVDHSPPFGSQRQAHS